MVTVADGGGGRQAHNGSEAGSPDAATCMGHDQKREREASRGALAASRDARGSKQEARRRQNADDRDCRHGSRAISNPKSQAQPHGRSRGSTQQRCWPSRAARLRAVLRCDGESCTEVAAKVAAKRFSRAGGCGRYIGQARRAAAPAGLSARGCAWVAHACAPSRRRAERRR